MSEKLIYHDPIEELDATDQSLAADMLSKPRKILDLNTDLIQGEVSEIGGYINLGGPILSEDK